MSLTKPAAPPPSALSDIVHRVVAGTVPPSVADESASAVPALTERERAMLEFEASWRRHIGAKEAAIREEFALTPARYYQLLERLIDTRSAMEYDALLVARLRRMRPDGGSPRAVSAY